MNHTLFEDNNPIDTFRRKEEFNHGEENSVTKIGSYAFYRCLDLSRIVIGGGMKTIPGLIFHDETIFVKGELRLLSEY